MFTAEDIANKHFRRALMGYDSEQVDLYLDEIIEQLNTMQQERKELTQTIEYLTAELARAGAQEGLKASGDKPIEPISPHVLK